MLRLALTLVLTISLCVSLGAPIMAAGASDFRDVKSGDWFYDAVDFAVGKGIFKGNGDGSFGPNDPITRGMFVTVLGRRVGVDTSTYPGSEFSDVASGAYYAPYINWATEHEIVKGTGTGKFSPDAEIARQDLVTILYRFMENPVLGDKGLIQDLWDFKDYSAVSGYAVEAVDWAYTNGVISGTSSGELRPTATASRAQVAQIFLNADELFGDVNSPANTQEMFDAISDAYEDRLTALTSGGKEVESTVVMEEMYTTAQKLEADGYIKNLEQTAEGIFYNYADGTLGGLVMELPEELSTTSSASLQSADYNPLPGDFAEIGAADETEAGLMATSNVIGNKKVFLGGTVKGNVSLLNSYLGLQQKIENSKRGHVVTNKFGKTTVDDFRNLSQYGAVFLSFPNVVWHNGVANIVLDQKFNVSTYDSNEYAKDRAAGRIGLYSVLSPQNPKANPVTDGYILSANRYEHNVAYVICTKSFFTNLPAFDHAYMHLGFQNSVSATAGLTRILQNKGVAAITGYDDLMRQSHDFKLVDLMLDVYLREQDKTVADADAAVAAAGLTTHKFTATYYKNTKWEIAKKEVSSMMQLVCTQQDSELVLWDYSGGGGSNHQIEILSATYVESESGGDPYYYYTVKCKNTSSNGILHLYATKRFTYGNGVFFDHELSLGDGNGFVEAAPGEEFQVTHLWKLADYLIETSSMELTITGYRTMNEEDVMFPESEWIRLDFKKVPNTNP